MNPRKRVTTLSAVRLLAGSATPSTTSRSGKSVQTVWRRASLAGLVLALLFLQQLGLAHRYTHNLAIYPSGVVASSALSSLPSPVVDAALSLPTHDKPFCLILDQLCMADAVPLLPLALLLLAPPSVLVFFGLHSALLEAVLPFQARGPPQFSPLLSP